jgi:hypothetical protein
MLYRELEQEPSPYKSKQYYYTIVQKLSEESRDFDFLY